MAVAIILGALAGLAGFIPLWFGLRLTRKTTHAGVAGSMTVLLLGLLVSFAVLLGCAFGCIYVARDLALPFVLAEVVALSVIAIVYGVNKILRK